ncbi:hypothetical protein LTR66_003407 [Elasticomyces elasticus]|nr:hypothetical protein LTR66_003407 [Elasticomyces elasticus]
MPVPPPDVSDKTQRAIDVFLASKKPDGQVGGIGHWQAANGYTAIALHDLWSHSDRNRQVIIGALHEVESYHRGAHENLINEFNDDTLWWGLCCIAAYRAYGGEDGRWCLQQARNIWRHVAKSQVGKGWYAVNGMDMEGGVFWSKRPEEDNLNAITTGLFAELGAELASIDGVYQYENGNLQQQQNVAEESHKHSGFLGKLGHGLKSRLNEQHASRTEPPLTYLSSSHLALTWILRCRYREDEAIVTDTIKLKNAEFVDWTFTYNTGAAIGACVALSQATGDRQYRDHACHMAEQSIVRPGWVTQGPEGGVLVEGCYHKERYGNEPWKNDDAVGFKSVLLRNIVKLLLHLQETNGIRRAQDCLQERVRVFVHSNWKSLQENNTNGNGQYGPWWDGPMALPTSHSQLAVLDVMAGIHCVR